ncbi:orotate phosphoribosyltransferase [Bacilli bacterium PM5-3]|nr:orotate phosphoribosyltransferase [Bacilli bacterium PM5-3]MDH6604217.1 orotate phosphoribosyltransferase [Bacilli bacterium PM5-9]
MEKTIAKSLLEIQAVFLKPDEPFTWASGIKSPIYCDNRLTLSFPNVRDIVEQGFVDLINKEFSDVDCIVGTATAGIGHAAIIASLMKKPMAYVRGSAKKHGRQNLIEGKIEKGAKIVLIEDLISTGKSSIECIEVLEKEGIEVLGVCAIFTYGMKKSIDNFKEINMPIFTLTNLDTLLEVASTNNYIVSSDIEKIKKFRDNPQDESWIK